MRSVSGGGLKFNVVLEGQAWMVVEGESSGTPAPVRVGPGDCFMISGQRAFRLGSDPSLTPRDARDVFADVGADGFVRLGAETDFRVIGGKMVLVPEAEDLLTRALPPVVRVPASHPAAATWRWLLELFIAERASARAGSAAMATHAMHMLLIELMRLSPAGDPPVGWLGALGDPHVGRALQAMHAKPAEAWTVEALAQQAFLSRSAFAQRFKQAVGLAPLDYLTRWRMHLARRELGRPGSTLADVAAAAGYASEGAFRAAFKRTFGHAPRRSPAAAARAAAKREADR